MLKSIVIRCAILIGVSHMIGPVGAAENMKDLAEFVQASAENNFLPLDADQQLLRLREFCFSKEAEIYRSSTGAGPTLLAAGLWVLLRYEYAALISTYSQSADSTKVASQAAAWRADQASQRFIDYTLEKGLATQETWSFRRAQAQLLKTEMRALLARPQSLSDLEDIVKSELARTFTPSASEGVNRDIQTSFRGLVRTVETTGQTAAAARLQAIGGLQQIYGPNPDGYRDANEKRLAAAERQLFYDPARYAHVSVLLKELSSGKGPSNADPDVSLIGDYADLREQLRLGEDAAPQVVPKGRPSPSFAEKFFGNDERETSRDGTRPSVQQIREFFEMKMAKQVPDPLDDTNDIKGYETSAGLIQGMAENLSAAPGTVTGERESTQIGALAGTYPPLAGVFNGGVPPKTPWFNFVSQKDARMAHEAVRHWLDDAVLNKKIEDSLRKQLADVASKTDTGVELFRELLNQLDNPN